MYVCVRMFVYMHVYIYICIVYVCVFVYIYMYLCMCVCVCMYVCSSVHDTRPFPHSVLMTLYTTQLSVHCTVPQEITVCCSE